MFFILILFNLQLNGQDFVRVEDEAQVLQQYSSAVSNLNSIRASYTQELAAPYLSKPVSSTGLFYYTEPSSFRWEQTTPEKYILVLRKDEAFVYENGKWKNFDSNKQRQFQFTTQLMMMLVSGRVEESGMFRIECYQNSDYLKINLIPRDKKVASYISSISCLARKSDNLLDSLEMQSADSTVTTITFRDQIGNANIPGELFEPEK